MPPIYVAARRRQLGNVDKDCIVLIFIFLLCVSVKANSFQELGVLKLNAPLTVVTEFWCYPFVFIMILPLLLASLVIVSFHRQVPSSRTACYPDDFFVVMIWQMPDLFILTQEPRDPAFSMTWSFLLKAQNHKNPILFLTELNLLKT